MNPFRLFDPSVLAAYCVAATVLVISPGPGQALIIARSVERGLAGGMLTSLGLNIGTLVHTFAAALGLSAILATSATAFEVVKYAGAVYLVALGALAIRRSMLQHAEAKIAPDAGDAWRLVLHATVAGILNPKVAVFFLAFLPQFVRPERGSVLTQFVMLGLILIAIGTASDLVMAVVIGRARRRFAGSARFAVWRERLMGAALLGLGLRLAFSDRR